MTTTACPTCGKPVDALRAPAAAVRDGKIVAYCSRECAAAAETKPTAKIQPTKIVRLPSSSDLVRASDPAIPQGTSPTVETGPVIEIVKDAGSAPARARRERTQPREVAAARASSQVMEGGAIQVADTGHIDDYIAFERPRRTGLVIGILVALLAGAAAGAYYLGYFDTLLGRKAATAVTPATESPGRGSPGSGEAAAPARADAAGPALTADAALARATDLLKAQLHSDSPRVQRVAAAALARTGDAGAIAQLVAMLDKEQSDLGKVEIAYDLARAPDAAAAARKKGLDALAAAVASGKRDPRLEAGRRLALLGDRRALQALESYLDVSQLRLGTAEQLAYLAEPKALKVLDEVRADPKSSADDKARAAIALGNAGRADIAPALEALLNDDRNNAFAANALANLHDDAARPVLVKQLAIPSLRVGAARALRRLAPTADTSALWPGLVAALDSHKDTEQVQVAEAILLLAGPAVWSERD